MTKPSLTRILSWIFYGLLAYMPFHLFLSRWLSLYTGGLGQWDAAKDVVTIFGLGIAIYIAFKNKLFHHKPVLYVAILSAVYGILHVAFFLTDKKDLDTRSAVVATLFNGRLFAYLFIGVVLAQVEKLNLRTLAKVVIVASTITCIFALIQYLAPKDLMTHFGYSIQRGAKPSFFIDDKPDFPRVMSTVRDPNSYGAYLLVPTLILYGYAIKRKFKDKRILMLMGLHLLALFLTFSRGAWIGVIIGLGVYTFLILRNSIVILIKKHLLMATVVFVLIVAGGLFFKNSYVFQNVFLHSDKSTVQADPNELRVQLTQRAINDVAADPEGHGPGNAGLVSIGNPKGAYLTENYYLQIAYEVGLLGLIIFILISAIVYLEISKNRNPDLLTRVVLASFWPYLFIATLIHLWSNEAVAAQWWLMAGVVLGLALGNSHNTQSSN